MAQTSKNFLVKFANLQKFYSVKHAKPYTRNTAYEGIQCKVTKIPSI